MLSLLAALVPPQHCAGARVPCAFPRTVPVIANANDWYAKDASFLDGLPPLGEDGPLLAGEAKAALRGKKVVRKPDARVRLFCLYGVADSSTSLRKWISSAPEWLEVRLLELAGHGYRADEELPLCAERVLDAPPSTGATLALQRDAWVCALADEVESLLAAQPDGSPYALYGFSFGALLSYELCRELAKRGSPAPLALVTSGRGAPHAVTFSTGRLGEVQTMSEEEVLAYFGTAFGVKVEKIAPSVRPRAAALFRCGALLGAPHVGATYDTEDVHNLWDDVTLPIAHATDVPALSCPVLALSGSLDVCWPPPLVARWRDVAPHPRDQTYRHIELRDTAHQPLMNSPDAMRVVYSELATRAMSQADSARAATASASPSLRKLESMVSVLGRECPWTEEQTSGSMLAFLREECTELESALSASASPSEINGELGDLLFNVLLAIEVCKRETGGSGESSVSLEAAAAASVAKLRRRYPPLEQGTLAEMSAEEASRVWLKGKEAEAAEAAEAAEEAALAAEIAELDLAEAMARREQEREDEKEAREELARLVRAEIARESESDEKP